MKCPEKPEIYSRVVGYFRPISNWNKGKQAEFENRRPFNLSQPDYKIKSMEKKHEEKHLAEYV